MQRKLFSKNAFLLAFLAVFLLMSTGCDKAKSSSAVNDLIDREVTATVTAINERDVKLARNIWSDLSELSVSLQKQDEDDLNGDRCGQRRISYFPSLFVGIKERKFD